MTRHEIGDISWEVTDKYGHPVEKTDIRDARIDTLFGDKKPDFMYNICLSGNDDNGRERLGTNPSKQERFFLTFIV